MIGRQTRQSEKTHQRKHQQSKSHSAAPCWVSILRGANSILKLCILLDNFCGVEPNNARHSRFFWSTNLQILELFAKRGVEDTKVKRLVGTTRSEEHTSELQSPCNIVCRILPE